MFQDLLTQMQTAAATSAKLLTAGPALEVTTTNRTFAMKSAGTASTTVTTNVMTETPPQATAAHNPAR